MKPRRRRSDRTHQFKQVNGGTLSLAYLQQIKKHDDRHRNGILAVIRALNRKSLKVGSPTVGKRVITYEGRQIGYLSLPPLSNKITVTISFGLEQRFQVIGSLQLNDKRCYRPKYRPKYRQFGTNVGATLKRMLVQAATRDVMES